MNVCATFPSSIPRQRLARPSILCVDDSREMLEICQTMLEAGGYEVFTATSGTEALQLLKLHSVDAAVVDNMMPGMSGLDLAREIKHAAAEVLVILFSASLQEDESFQFVDSCLSKGKGPIALRKLLGSLLRT